MTWPLDPLEPGSYGTVVCDAPWSSDITQRLGGKGRRPAAANRHYSTMTPCELAALPVGDLVGESGHCWLMVTNAVLAAGRHRSVLEAWGFRPVTVLTWCKPGGNGLGTYLRGATEHAVLAVKGWGTVPERPWPSTWFEAARTAHSVKPGSFYDIAEAVSPGPYVELFQRQGRFNWTGWGWGHELGESA